MSVIIPPTHTDWIQTFTGGQFWPLEPRVEDVEIIDIAHALASVCRFAGHCESFYSVAQHSVLVSRVVPPEHALRGLLHDASEAYLNDVCRPIKHSDGMEAYRAAEKRLQAVIYERFGIFGDDPTCVKTADNQVLRTEQRDLMKPAPVEWEDNRVGALSFTINPWLPAHAKAVFLGRFEELSKA